MKKTTSINTILIICVCFLLFTIALYINKVYAETENNGKTFVSIIVSKTCQRSDRCPSYKELADLFDNSNRYISGDFIFDNDTNSWKRGKPIFQNDFEIYKYGAIDVVTFVDPNDLTRQRSKLIYIESSMNVIIDRGNNMDRDLRLQYSELIKSQDNLESERLNKKFTLVSEESLLESYKNKMQTAKNTMEQKKLYYEQLVANGAESTETIALQKNAETDYNNSVTENNNAINQYNVQKIKLDKLQDELDVIQSKFSSNAKIIKNNFNVKGSFSMTNNTVTYGANRMIDGCEKATIGWNPYGAKLLADTLNYFRNNCNTTPDTQDYSKITSIEVYQPPTIFKDCSKWCEHMKWLTNAKNLSKNLHLDLNKSYQKNGTE